MSNTTTPDYRTVNANKNPEPMAGETFKSVPGYEGMYEVSDYGRVISHKRGRPRVLKGTANAGGYILVDLCRDGKSKMSSVHRLVALAHLGPAPTDKPNVLHANDIKVDNRLPNLRYGDDSENSRDKLLNGNHNYASATHCKRGHSFTAANTRVYENGKRHCISCQHARDASRRAADRADKIDFNEYADQKYIELTTAPGANLAPVISTALAA